MFEDFTTIDYLLSFPGMIAAVIMLTQFTKRMFDKLVHNRTKYVVYFFSALFCVFAAAFYGQFGTTDATVQTVLVWLVNSVIVWFAAMKTFETVKGNTDGTLFIDTSDPERDVWRLDLGEDLPYVAKKKELRLKVDPNARLSQE